LIKSTPKPSPNQKSRGEKGAYRDKKPPMGDLHEIGIRVWWSSAKKGGVPFVHRCGKNLSRTATHFSTEEGEHGELSEGKKGSLAGDIKGNWCLSTFRAQNCQNT